VDTTSTGTVLLKLKTLNAHCVVEMLQPTRRPYLGDSRVQPLEMAARVLDRLPEADRNDLLLRLVPCIADDSDPLPALEPYLTLEERSVFPPSILPRHVPTHCACSGRFVLVGSERVCEWCGVQGVPPPSAPAPFGIDARPPKRRCIYSRSVHLRGYLDDLQARSTTRLYAPLAEAARKEVKKHRIAAHSLTPSLLRKVLKPYRLSRHYNSLPRVIIELGGPPPPQIPPHVEAEVLKSFRLVEEGFLKTRDRKNVPGMAFIVSQLLRLHGTDPSPWIMTKLQTRAPQVAQDRRWKLICEASGIPYLGT